MSGHSIILVCEVKNRVIGQVSVEKKGGKISHVGELGIAVHPAYWNLGVGTALINAAIQRAKKEGISKLYLEVVRENRRAILLYKKFGFKVEGLLKKHFRMDDGRFADLVIMSKFI